MDGHLGRTLKKGLLRELMEHGSAGFWIQGFGLRVDALGLGFSNIS